MAQVAAVGLLGQRLGRLPPRVHEQRDPRHERQRGHDRPLAERDAPARGIGHGNGDERRGEGADRHRGHVEGGHQPDAIGEVPLHERRQQHVGDADRGERERARGDERRAPSPRGRATRARGECDRATRSSVPSRPNRRAMSGVRMPNTAKHSGGSMPRNPSTTGSSVISASTWSRIGESDATAVRRLNATSTMPMRASERPAQSGRGGIEVIPSSLWRVERLNAAVSRRGSRGSGRRRCGWCR